MSAHLPNVEPIRREPLAAEIARRLVDYLLSGGIEPGTRIPSERQLAEAFGVGRSAVREAIAALTLIGLIEVRHGDGTYLKRPDSPLLPQVVEWGLLLGEPRTIDLVEARQKIEVDIVGLAAARCTEEDVADLARILGRMERASHRGASAEAFVDADVAFHLRLAEAARNSALRDVLSGIQALLRAWIGRVIAQGSVDISYGEHVPIFEA
ncbi:MAG: FadR family transcriptional regulator, partial [Thermomicrobiales bacterium]|nr:FadR family transcriptional regulator [Thermomicrobiales bacterium]